METTSLKEAVTEMMENPGWKDYPVVVQYDDNGKFEAVLSFWLENPHDWSDSHRDYTVIDSLEPICESWEQNDKSYWGFGWGDQIFTRSKEAAANMGWTYMTDEMIDEWIESINI